MQETEPRFPETSPASGEWHPTGVRFTDERREQLLTDAREYEADFVRSVQGVGMDNDDSEVLTGRIGEMVFTEIFGGEYVDSTEYDIRLQDMRVEVKTLKRTVRPQSHYNAVVTNRRKERVDCDLYYFTSILGDGADNPWSKIWLCGYITPDRFEEQATFWEQDEVDPENGFQTKVDAWRIQYQNLQRRDLPKEILL